MNEFEYMICRIEETFEIYSPLGFIQEHKLNTKSRIVDIVIIRQELMYRIRQKTTLSLSKIGSLFNRDHATVIHSINSVKNMRKTKDKTYLETIERYSEGLKCLNYKLL